jgi:hypothetical protein
VDRAVDRAVGPASDERPGRRPLRLLIADRDQRRCASPDQVTDIAGYLDDVADELARRSIPVFTMEIDTRAPVTGRLVLDPGSVLRPLLANRPLALTWRQDTGWSVAEPAVDGPLAGRRGVAPGAPPATVADFLQRSAVL